MCLLASVYRLLAARRYMTNAVFAVVVCLSG